MKFGATRAARTCPGAGGLAWRPLRHAASMQAQCRPRGRRCGPDGLKGSVRAVPRRNPHERQTGPGRRWPRANGGKWKRCSRCGLQTPVRAGTDVEGQFHWRDPGERQSVAGGRHRRVVHGGGPGFRLRARRCGGGGARRGPSGRCIFPGSARAEFREAVPPVYSIRRRNPSFWGRQSKSSIARLSTGLPPPTERHCDGVR